MGRVNNTKGRRGSKWTPDDAAVAWGHISTPSSQKKKKKNKQKSHKKNNNNNNGSDKKKTKSDKKKNNKKDIGLVPSLPGVPRPRSDSLQKWMATPPQRKTRSAAKHTLRSAIPSPPVVHNKMKQHQKAARSAKKKKTKTNKNGDKHSKGVPLPIPTGRTPAWMQGSHWNKVATTTVTRKQTPPSGQPRKRPRCRLPTDDCPHLDQLSNELRAFGSYVTLTPSEHRARNSLIDDLNQLLLVRRRHWRFGDDHDNSNNMPRQPEQSPQLRVFGSFATPSVCVFNSDIDVALWGVVPSPEPTAHTSAATNSLTAPLPGTPAPSTSSPVLLQNNNKSSRALERKKQWMQLLDKVEGLAVPSATASSDNNNDNNNNSSSNVLSVMAQLDAANADAPSRASELSMDVTHNRNNSTDTDHLPTQPPTQPPTRSSRAYSVDTEATVLSEASESLFVIDRVGTTTDAASAGDANDSKANNETVNQSEAQHETNSALFVVDRVAGPGTDAPEPVNEVASHAAVTAACTENDTGTKNSPRPSSPEAAPVIDLTGETSADQKSPIVVDLTKRDDDEEERVVSLSSGSEPEEDDANDKNPSCSDDDDAGHKHQVQREIDDDDDGDSADPLQNYQNRRESQTPTFSGYEVVHHKGANDDDGNVSEPQHSPVDESDDDLFVTGDDDGNESEPQGSPLDESDDDLFATGDDDSSDEEELEESRRRCRSGFEEDCSDSDTDMQVSIVARHQSIRPITKTAFGPTGRMREHVLNALGNFRSTARMSPLVRKVNFISRARVPILKMDTTIGVEVDIAVGGHNGADTSHFAAKQAEIYESFPTVVVFLKILLNQQRLDVPFTGGLGSYKLYVLVAHHIQRHLALGGNDTPGEVLLSFFFRYGCVDGHNVSEACRTPLQQMSVLEFDSDSNADMSNVFHWHVCKQLFRQCWDRLWKGLHRASAQNSNSWVELVIDTELLERQRAQSHRRNETHNKRPARGDLQDRRKRMRHSYSL